MQIPAEKEVSGTEYVLMCFTFDSRYLVTVIGEPDWEMIVFRCDRGKIESSTRASNPNGTGTVAVVSAPKKYISREIVLVFCVVVRPRAIQTIQIWWCWLVINC